jgi:ribosomal protein S12 methylthiotransferase accessory factor
LAEAEKILEADYRPPIKRGDLLRDLEAGSRGFAIIDGEFGQNLSVNLTELRIALERGATVCGAASMGALRAFEAAPLGMHGLGWIYGLYCNSQIDGDDEVALLFDPITFRPITEPLINVRWAVDVASNKSVLTAEQKSAIIRLARQVPWWERTMERLKDTLQNSSVPQYQAFFDLVASDPASFDRKRLDALQCLHALSAGWPAQGMRGRKRWSRFQGKCLGAPSAEAFVGRVGSCLKASGSSRERDDADLLAHAYEDAIASGTSRLADLTELDWLKTPVMSATRPLAEEGDLTVLGGKGFTPEQAKLSAFGEAVERACLSPRGRTLRSGTLSAMRVDGPTLDPRTLILNLDSSWDEAKQIEWCQMRSLISDELVWVPADAVFFPYRGPHYLFSKSTGGTAAGSSLPDATLAALYEIVERDAHAFATYLGSGKLIKPSSICDSSCQHILHLAALNGARVLIALIGSDISIPVIFAIIDDSAALGARYVSGGLGCNLDPIEAVRAALLEAVYSRLTMISGAREDLAFPEEQSGFPAGLGRISSISDELGLWADDRGIDINEIPDVSTRSISTDLQRTIHAVRAAGLNEILAAELSNGNTPIKVVRVVVPGAEFALDRLRIGPRIREMLLNSTQ